MGRRYMIGNVYLITAIAVVGGGLFGFDISSMSAIITTEAYLCYFNQGSGSAETGDCQGPTASVQGGITAAMPGGSFVGALASGLISDYAGRKGSIQYGCLIWILGSILVCASQNIGMLVVGRFINGLSVGICSAQVPVYISELAPPSKRGRLTGVQQWAITWGILIMYYISFGAAYIHGGKSTAVFRLPWGLQMIPAILLAVALFFTPESPRWLAKHDRWEDCHEVLALVHAKGDRDAAFVRRELQEIRDACEFERQSAEASFLELCKPNMINRTHIGVMMQVWSQLTGMNVEMYYISYVFGMAGLHGNAGLVSSSIQYVINVFMTLPALIWLDRWGRRRTMIAGAICMQIFMYANAGLLAAHGAPAPPGGLNHIPQESWSVQGPASKAVIACTYLFVASYAPTIGPISWVYPPELFPLRLRGKAMGLCAAGNWIFNFALAYFVPPAFVNIKWKTYIVFGVFLTAMTVHFYFCFPETAGKTLEELEEMWASKTPARKTKVQYGHALELEHGHITDGAGKFVPYQTGRLDGGATATAPHGAHEKHLEVKEATV